MISQNIGIILIVSGAITASMLIKFLFPRWYLKKALDTEFQHDLAILFARHWGLLVFLLGMLMVWAGFDESIRKPIALMALIEKAWLAGWVFYHISEPYAKKMLPAAVFDTLVSVLLIAYFLGW